MPNSLLDMMGVGPYSSGGSPDNTIPIPGESGFQVNPNPASYSPGATMSGMNDVIYSYNPQGTYSGTPMELAPDFQYGGGFNGGFSGGTNVTAGQAPNWWQRYQNRDTSTGGGMFTLADLFAGRPGGLPNQFQAGADQPSSNNYRLIPNPEYRKPGFIIRNGRVINTQLAGNDVGGGQPFLGSAGTDLGGMARINIGSGAGYGMPAMGYKNVFWPGQVERAQRIPDQWE